MSTADEAVEMVREFNAYNRTRSEFEDLYRRLARHFIARIVRDLVLKWERERIVRALWLRIEQRRAALNTRHVPSAQEEDETAEAE